MPRTKWVYRTLIKYTLLQIPALLLLILILLAFHAWLGLPLYVLAGIVVFWVLKDALMYHFVWPAYDSSSPGKSNTKIGRKGIAIKNIEPLGYIRIDGEFWKARPYNKNEMIKAGDPVTIVAHDGLVLIVEKTAG